jgi:7-cyano-7-deazaguanine synthase
LRIVVLSSGGIDSSVMLKLLKKAEHLIFPLFVDYGQLAATNEWKACKSVCKHLDLNPTRMDISGFGKLIPSGITNSKLDIEKEAFLPTRNLLLLTLGAAYGYDKSAFTIAIGLLSNPIFPDQTSVFIQETQKAIGEALGLNITILAPLLGMTKADTIRLAQKYRLPMDTMYSCHLGGTNPCGFCISCKEKIEGEKWKL